MIIEYASETPTGKLRWNAGADDGRVLEQEWLLRQFRNGNLINTVLEWRVVPSINLEG